MRSDSVVSDNAVILKKIAVVIKQLREDKGLTQSKCITIQISMLAGLKLQKLISV